MLMENAKDIPVLQQHGEIDDNVPAYNSRLLSQQLFQAGTNSSFNEFAGQNHWWDTVMTTDPMKSFYHAQSASNASIPRKVDEFAMVVGDPGDTGSKGGIRVLNLEDPGQYGKLNVKGRTITTSNILSIELDGEVLGLDGVTVDGHELALSGKAEAFAKKSDTWEVSCPSPLLFVIG
jgi:hypothetical protein